LKNYLKALIIIPLLILALGIKTYTPDKVFQAIKNKRTLYVGISQHYPPLNFNGKSGFDIELAKAIGTFLDVKVVFRKLKITQYISAIENRKVDVVIAGMSRNIKRGQRIWFSTPYITVTPAMLVNKRLLPQQKMGDEFESDAIKNIWDLKRLTYFTIAVKRGSAYIDLLNQQMPDMKQKLISSNDEGFALIKKGRINGFIHDSLYLEYMYNKDTKLRNTCTLLKGGKQVEKLCVGLPFGDIVLKNQIDLLINELKRTGHIDKWLKRYKRK